MTYTLIGAGKRLAAGNLVWGKPVKVNVSLDGVYRLRLQVKLPDPNGSSGCGTEFSQVTFGDAEVLGL